MKQPLKIKAPDHSQPVRNALREARLVAAAGIVLALGANLVSPRGLALTRNYFPAGINRPVPAANGGASIDVPASAPAQLLAARLKEQGLQSVDGRQAAQLFHDPRFQPGGHRVH